MLKPLLLGSCLALSVLACSTTPPAHHELVASRPADSFCVRATGTRIPRSADECAPVSGRSYSRDTLDTTGASTLADALRMLDPAITSGGP